MEQKRSYGYRGKLVDGARISMELVFYLNQMVSSCVRNSIKYGVSVPPGVRSLHLSTHLADYSCTTCISVIYRRSDEFCRHHVLNVVPIMLLGSFISLTYLDVSRASFPFSFHAIGANLCDQLNRCGKRMAPMNDRDEIRTYLDAISHLPHLTGIDLTSVSRFDYVPVNGIDIALSAREAVYERYAAARKRFPALTNVRATNGGFLNEGVCQQLIKETGSMGWTQLELSVRYADTYGDSLTKPPHASPTVDLISSLKGKCADTMEHLSICIFDFPPTMTPDSIQRISLDAERFVSSIMACRHLLELHLGNVQGHNINGWLERCARSNALSNLRVLRLIKSSGWTVEALEAISKSSTQLHTFMLQRPAPPHVVDIPWDTRATRHNSRYEFTRAHMIALAACPSLTAIYLGQVSAVDSDVLSALPPSLITLSLDSVGTLARSQVFNHVITDAEWNEANVCIDTITRTCTRLKVLDLRNNIMCTSSATITINSTFAIR